MKCIILAGGKGDRLWPLSRVDYPKQFIRIQGDHSLFQETVARNMPYCNEFIIVANADYRFIVENQLSAFQGLTYRCIYEGTGRKTAAAVTLACLQLPQSEIALVVPADQIISGDAYKKDIMRARELGREGGLVTFGIAAQEPQEHYGYIRYSGEDVEQFVEKPDAETVRRYWQSGEYVINSGMFLFQVGIYLNELRLHAPVLLEACRAAHRMRQADGGNYLYVPEVMRQIPAIAVEKAVFEKTRRAKVVHASFGWKDIGQLEDIKSTELKTPEDGQQVQYRCGNTDIINHCSKKVVVANGVEDLVIVNTKDAVYVGKKGESDRLKNIIEENPQIGDYVLRSRVRYSQWGSHEILMDGPGHRVEQVAVSPGKTVYAHKHLFRNEHWMIVSGSAVISLDGREGSYGAGDMVDVNAGVVHQVSNIGLEPLIIIEMAVGSNVDEEDRVPEKRPHVTEEDLGMEKEPFIKLLPAFKDHLWGGSRLKEIYRKKCDYDIVAESWELSAHEAGQSIVANGRHRGMSFAEYLNVIGKNSWGWKCRALDAFPILIKFIDAEKDLSVQVHPDDEYALAVENQYGKNEMWYIIDCKPDAAIYCGFDRDMDREEVRRRIAEGTITQVLNRIPVKKGEAYFIPSGTVHAIGAGIFLCEVQQSSDCSYRLYDYDRKDRFGNRRELHIEKALEVLSYSRYVPQKLDIAVETEENFQKRVISRCKYFECVDYKIHGAMSLPGIEESFTSLICIAGKGRISLHSKQEVWMDFCAGESLFMPKSTDIYRIEGDAEIIITRV